MRRLVVIAAILVSPMVARANPRTLPFTYTTDTLASGSAELEQFVDLVPLRAISASSTREETYLAFALQTELEIGLTDRLELGLYITVVPDPGVALAGAARFPGAGNGLKQRLRYRLHDKPDTLPIVGNAAGYLELSENLFEIEAEGKLILERRMDPVRVAANLTAEYEWYFSGEREVVLAPSVGVSYEIKPSLHLGLEGWMRGEFQRPAPASPTFGLRPQVYVGPTMMLAVGRVWWTLGLYGRVTEMSHHMAPGDPYGRVWLRSMIGYDLSR
ncbi:MAG: hypothetical protein KF773_06840 [Deltaproteobacteria bacterium]|nr:hypothetical protein [Deltaproteobacteria bacterium]